MRQGRHCGQTSTTMCAAYGPILVSSAWQRSEETDKYFSKKYTFLTELDSKLSATAVQDFRSHHEKLVDEVVTHPRVCPKSGTWASRLE